MVHALFVALCFVFSSHTFADYFDPIAGNSPLVTSMFAEAYSLELVSTLTPMPDPKSFKELVEIANDYQEIAKDTMFFHSLSLRAVLPVQSPDPNKAMSRLPPPQVLAKKAVRFQEHALFLVNRLDRKIDSAYEHGTIVGEAYFKLLDIQTSLRDQIATLPTPLPWNNGERSGMSTTAKKTP